MTVVGHTLLSSQDNSRKPQGSDAEGVARVEPRVPVRAQVPWGMTALSDGGPPNSSMRQSVTEGRNAVAKSAL